MITQLQDRVALEAGPAIGTEIAEEAAVITGELASAARKAAAADEGWTCFAPMNGTKKDKVDNLLETAPRHGDSVGIAFGTARFGPLEDVSTIDTYLGPNSLLAMEGSSSMPTAFLIDGDISAPYVTAVL
ncbi:hypothetical protein [Nocardioides glacieisoli]|uniref:hypothetical protein n=1 Tax=Nocardioides glacieisoli TaxID=1168730 RepID=UPI0013ED8EFA|nr:hypothetical protein [Nocardioides glacieisoli]